MTTISIVTAKYTKSVSLHTEKLDEYVLLPSIVFGNAAAFYRFTFGVWNRMLEVHIYK